jgi:hypothetical protein
MGPDIIEPNTIRFSNACVVWGNTLALDMVVNTEGVYNPYDSARNGKSLLGPFGLISVRVGTRVHLRARFVRAGTDTPVVVHSFFFSLFNMHQFSSENMMIVRAGGLDSYYVASGSQVDHGNVHFGAAFQSSSRSTWAEEPMDPLHLTHRQELQVVSMLYSNKSEFNLSFAVSGTEGNAGRDFLFAGRAEITEHCTGGRGAPGRPSLPFDCAAGYSNWRAGWSLNKQRWCCEHGGRGCPEKYNCYAHGTWSLPQADWCCRNENRGCPSTEAPYDCNTPGLWSLSQRQYCCSTVHRGCEPVKPTRLNEQRWPKLEHVPSKSFATTVAFVSAIGLTTLAAARAIRLSRAASAGPAGDEIRATSVRPILLYTQIEDTAAEPALSL